MIAVVAILEQEQVIRRTWRGCLSNPCSPHSSSAVNGGCATTGSAKLIFRMIRNGVRKNSSSQHTARAPRARSQRCASRPLMMAGVAHVRSRIVLPRPTTGTLRRPTRPSSFADASQVLRADLQHGAALQQHPVQRLIAEVAQVAHDALHARCDRAIRRIAADRDLLGPHGHADLGPRRRAAPRKARRARALSAVTLQRHASRARRS